MTSADRRVMLGRSEPEDFIAFFLRHTTLYNRGVEINNFYGASRCRLGRFGIGSVIDYNRL